MINKLC